MAESTWLTVEEYAALKRRSRWTVYRHFKQGLIPGAEQVVEHGEIRIPVPVLASVA